jgi:hypothetical protein
MPIPNPFPKAHPQPLPEGKGRYPKDSNMDEVYSFCDIELLQFTGPSPTPSRREGTIFKGL